MRKEPDIDAFDLCLKLDEFSASKSKKSEPREERKELNYRDMFIREIESLEVSSKRQEYETPKKSSEMCAKEVV